MNNPKVNVVVSGHRNEYHSTYKTYILRGGVPFADQVIMPDTKYVIKHDFDLGGRASDLDFSNADTHTVAEVTYYYIPFIADGSKYTLMDDTLVFIDAEWNGLSAREIKPEKGTLFMIASITGGLHKNGYGINVVTVPENCILEFDGGSLDNGVIVGQDTVYINVGDVDIWGNNLTREGTWREHSGGSENYKPYDPEIHSGLGKKFLCLKLDGSNILTQEDFDQENTIYVIQYDFDLDGATIEVPEGCVLDFEGGSTNNGKLIGNNTTVLNNINNSTALYGLYYDSNGDILNYCYGKRNDFHINECYTFVDDMIDAEEPAEYQSIVRYNNYLFIIGYPWSTANATALNHYQVYIRVFDINNNYAFVGTAYTNIMSHANGATVVGNTLYVCPADGNKHDGEYINPERKGLHTFNCADIVNAAVTNSPTKISNNWINLGSLESTTGLSLDYIMGIDYDEAHNEFALDVNGTILILDDNFEYIRRTENYKNAILEKYRFSIGTQDIVYKNGIIYGNFGSFDYSSSNRRGTLVNHPVLVTIDSVSGLVIDCKDIETPYQYWENQGGCKDVTGDRIWSLFVNRKTDAVNPAQIKTYTIAIISPDTLGVKDTKRGLVTDSDRHRLLGNGQYLEIYVDSTTENTIQEGTYQYPFKTLEQALHTVRTISDNIVFKCRNGRTYKAQLGAVVGKTIRIQSYTGDGDSVYDTPIIDICGKFYNCYVSLQYVKIAPTQGFSSNSNSCIVVNNTLFMMQHCYVLPKNYDSAIVDENNYHNKNNWSICDGFVSSTNSKVDFIDCTFIGLKHILHSYRGITGSFDQAQFESISEIIKADDSKVSINITNYDISIYYEVTKLIIFTSAKFYTEPCINFVGYTSGNFLAVLAAAHKTGINNVVSYNQLAHVTFTSEEVADWAKDIIISEYNTTADNLDFHGTLHIGNYKYIVEYEVGRFQDGFYNILGCAKRGTTEQMPVAKYPFMIKNGYEYFNDETHVTQYWNGTNWIDENGGGVTVLDNLEGKTINFIGDSYIANNGQSFENTWAYLLGQRHNMTVNNYGINGNAIVAAEAESGGIAPTGTPMVTRYSEMANDVDYVIVVGGKNDYNAQIPISDFKAGLITLIEGLISKYTPYNEERLSYCKIAFFTPWKVYLTPADDPNNIKLEEYVRAMVEICNTYSIPIFNSSLDGGVMMYNQTFRTRYCQSSLDVSHFNSGGHIYFLTKAEKFIEGL